ncbi:MAG: N-acetylmuramoyl-L-alanine amidase [Chlorobi bacterium]|nr:N-acetylmuramoyl-L-alanine amidase [Chlorobiota bacterium]
MKRGISVFLIAVSLHTFMSLNAQTIPENSYKLKRVVIDAGHGGKDPGALGRRSYEKNITLAIALKLGKYIEQNMPDVKVIYTRKTDEFIELYQRGDIANKNHADLFISVHCNSNPNKAIRGAETYVMGLHTDEKNMAVAMKENAVISLENDYTLHYEGYDPNSVESFILFSLMQNTYLEQSLEFASLIQDQFRTRAHRPDRGVRQAGFIVLWRTTMPSVLVETGYLSNATEEKYLLTGEGQSLIASAIYRAFREYKSMIESRSAFSLEPVSPADSIRFGVQIASSRKPLAKDHPLYKKYKNLMAIRDGKWYKYVTGSSNSYEEAKKLKHQVTLSVKDAFVVAIKNGKIIPLKTALSEIKQ